MTNAQSNRSHTKRTSSYAAPFCLSACALVLACGDPNTEDDGDDERSGDGSGGGTGGTLSSGGAPSNTGGVSPGTGGASGGAGSGGDASGTGGAPDAELSFAEELHELFIDRLCAESTSLPLADGAVCDHRNNLLHTETEVTFGGEAGATYLVTLRVRGIWEPTNIDGGEQPLVDTPFNVGGDVAAGSGSDSDAINYQQFYIEVASPEQTYWLNNHDYVAHDIHKVDYEATLLIEGGSLVKVIAHDGNERQIANFPQEFFADLPPYDQTPTLGQFLRLDVVDVALSP